MLTQNARQAPSFRAGKESAGSSIVVTCRLSFLRSDPYTVHMSSFKAFRFQLRTKPGMEVQLRRYAGQLRWIWCKALAEQRARHARGEKYAGHAEMCKWLTAWRHAPESSWLAMGPMHPQQQVLRRLDEAYLRFFKKAGGFPSFKRRGEEPGIRFPDPKQFELDAANGRIRLPKLGWVRLRLSCPVEGTLRNVSLTREGNRWFAAIQVEVAETVPATGLAPTLGIDLGLTAFAATATVSTGCLFEPLKALAKQQRRIKHAQRCLSRKKKGSSNRKKAIARLGNLHRRVARQRADWLHKLSSGLAGRHPVIAVEDLQVKILSASAAGTVASPGRNVKAKAGLNRSILDAAWGEFARQLSYKTAWRGGQVIRVNPAYTSQTCSACGHCSADNRKSQALFACVACRHAENADLNAAKNILAAGHAVWSSEKKVDACGGVVRRKPARKRAAGAAPVKQEPTEGIAHA